jgi:eukaryotic-like serine/threonine-protein kinase
VTTTVRGARSRTLGAMPSSSSSAGPPRTDGSASPTRVGGRYVLRGELGRGGMATVHRARDEVLDRDVAIKLLHAHLARDPAFLDRFRREARAAAALAHPNVVAVHDWGETEDGPFLVLQIVDGPSLRSVLRHRGRLLAAEAVAVLAPAAGGLAAAHDAGLVHRDVKPENLLLGVDGTVRVTDFGLARAAASATSTFGTDVLVGSPHYLSPEAVRGEPLDPRADVYALGVVLYEVLTGRPPYEADSPFATAVQHTSQRVPAPSLLAPSVPRELDRVVARATSPSADDRYPDARAFALALSDAVPHEGATVPGLVHDVQGGAHPPRDGGTVVLPVDAQDTTIAGRPDVGTDDGAPAGPEATDDVPSTGTAALWPPPVPPPVSEDLAGADGDEADDAWRWGDGPVAELDPAREPSGTWPPPPAPPPAEEGDDDGPVVVGRGRRRWPVTLVVVALLLAASAAGGYLLWDRVLAPVTGIPAVEGASETQAVGALEEAGFDVRIEDGPFDLETPEGHVLDQAPVGRARQGSRVTVVLSAGPRPVDVIDVRGQPADEAEAALRGSGLEVERTERFDEELGAGLALGTDPGPGVTVDETTTVELSVSLGREPIPVPDVRGRDLEDAQDRLADAGLDAEVVGRTFSDEVEEGAVLAQEPSDGQERFAGDVVELTLSDGPAPIEVPNVRGQLQDEAVDTLEELGFDLEIEERGGFGAFLNPGRVFEQDPGPGAERFPDDTVRLFVYED